MCADADIAVVATPESASFSAGAQPRLGMKIKNTGDEQCRRDLSGTLQVYTVQAADGSHIWSTADCFPGEGAEVRDLAPGQTLEYLVKWSGTRSAPGCAGERAPVAPGKYQLVAQLGALSSAPARFSITA